MSIESDPNIPPNPDSTQGFSVDQPTPKAHADVDENQSSLGSVPAVPQEHGVTEGLKTLGVGVALAAKREANAWVETFKTIGLSVVLALGIRHFVAEARYIPSESMLPTLEVNDRLIVEKVSYYFNDPQRGDIIVFWPTEQLRQQNPSIKDAFIKRVIGLPGETVEVRNGKVYINNQVIEENYIEAPPNYQWGPAIVPDNEYLVLGDNRNNSFDSHFWGSVPRENIIGRAVVRFWPLNRLGEIGPTPPYQAEN